MIKDLKNTFYEEKLMFMLCLGCKEVNWIRGFHVYTHIRGFQVSLVSKE